MTKSEVALIVGGGPGISASCARLFAQQGMQVAVAARQPDKPALLELKKDFGVHCFACDAQDKASVDLLFNQVEVQLGVPNLVVHNIDGRSKDIFRKPIAEADPDLVMATLRNSAYSAFLVGQKAAQLQLGRDPGDTATNAGTKGTIIFTNASAAFKGYPLSGAFAMASHAKAGLAQSMARELMPQGIHVVHVPIDAAIAWTQKDGSRKHWLAGTSNEDNMADPDHIAQAYLQLHQQHRSTWAFEMILRPWVESW